MTDPTKLQERVERLAEIRARLDKATKGPWHRGAADMRCTIEHRHGGSDCRYTFQGWYNDSEYFDRFVSVESDKSELIGSHESGAILSLEDADFIAHAWQDITDLLKMLDETPRGGEKP